MYNVATLRGPYNDVTGQRFGNFTVLRLEQTKGGYEYRAICRCDKCGRTDLDKRVRDVKDGSARCPCSRYEWQKRKQAFGNNILFTGIGDMNARYLSNAARRAKKKGWAFDLDAAFLWDLYQQQKQQCALSGLPINFAVNTRRAEGTASLDRINNNGGYVKGNVQWVHKDVNYMKRTMDDDRFVELCRLVVQWKAA